MDKHSPTPWRVADIDHDHDILDADGKVAARAAHGNKELAALIVEAVNERDRLRDLVARLAEYIRREGSREVCVVSTRSGENYYVKSADLLREAREALGEAPDGK